jgi:hypothetical protein
MHVWHVLLERLKDVSGFGLLQTVHVRAIAEDRSAFFAFFFDDVHAEHVRDRM